MVTLTDRRLIAGIVLITALLLLSVLRKELPAEWIFGAILGVGAALGVYQLYARRD